MIILGIETSCDETGVAILKIKEKESKIEILANELFSQAKLHAKYGGVYPTLAKREHKKNLPVLLKRAIEKANPKKIDLLAVTVGPGLDPCLWEGINFAKEFAKKEKISIVPVNHIEAHILINFLSNLNFNLFPTICLIVSGGHTQLILMKKIGNYKILGETRDDAAGECLDKVARLLGLGYPGGPAIEKIASLKLQASRFKIHLPRPMINQKNFDFSFSGLKTAVLYDFKNKSEKERKSKEYKVAMAREVQQAVIDVLIEKTLRAAKIFKVKAIVFGGGVMANKQLRKQLVERIEKETPKVEYFIPEPKYCTDNGVMVAIAGFFHKKRKIKNFEKIKAEANLKVSVPL